MPAASIDVSDTSVKYMEARKTKYGFVPVVFDEIVLSEGIVSGGRVIDADALRKILHSLHKKYTRDFVHVGLPEEGVYLFQTEVTKPRNIKQTRSEIEFMLSEHVPIKIEDAIFDYDIVSYGGKKTVVSVTVFTKEIINGYLEALRGTGFTIKSLELEASSMVRSVLSKDTGSVSMVVDFGRSRTGLIIAKNSVPIFTTTINIGGDSFTQAIADYYKVDIEEAEEIKILSGEDVGLGDEKMQEALKDVVGVLLDELKRHYYFWDSKRNTKGEKISKIDSVVLCGGGAAFAGLAEFLADEMRLPTSVASVWQHMFSLENFVPKITRSASLKLATLIGLLLKEKM